jgi:putative oxidoreductase
MDTSGATVRMFTRLKFSTWVPVPLRLIVGCGFMEHGYAKLLVGAFIPFASVPMAAVLLVAMFSVHWQYGFSSIKLIAITPNGANFGPPGYECDLLYLACLVALVLGGSGPLSFDLLMSKIVKASARTRP